MIKKTLTSLLLAITVCSIYGQATSEKEWQKFVNVGFEFKMPTNDQRPMSIPYKETQISKIFEDVNTYDLAEYSGSNEQFRCTIQLVAFDEIETDLFATKILEEYKSDLSRLKNIEIVSEKINKMKKEQKIEFIFNGGKRGLETFTFIVWLTKRRAIATLLVDTSPEKKWSKYFIENFHLID